MVAKQQYSVFLYAALLGSVAQHVQAAEQFPTCITSCLRQSGCPPTDVDCMCKKASGNFLSDVVICMNQWCTSDTKFGDLIGPIQSNCDIPKSAIQDAEKKAGFDTGSSSDDSQPSSTSEPKEQPSSFSSVGAPHKIDGPSTSASAPAASGTQSVVLSDTTAVVTDAPTASNSLLVAPSTLTSAVASTPTGTSGSTNEDSTSSEQTTQGSGSTSGGKSTEEGSATTSRASMLAAVLAVGAAMAFSW